MQLKIAIKNCFFLLEYTYKKVIFVLTLKFELNSSIEHQIVVKYILSNLNHKSNNLSTTLKHIKSHLAKKELSIYSVRSN